MVIRSFLCSVFRYAFARGLLVGYTRKEPLIVDQRFLNAVGGESWLGQLTVSKAIGRMIVDHANGLHERVANY